MNESLGGILGVDNTFGMPSQELHDLAKALGTGTAGPAYGDGGAPLRVQSLEGILKVVTYQDRNIVFWKDIPKLQAYNTVEEFNQLKSYGGSGSGFFTEGGLPNEEDSDYERKTALIKFMGTTGIVTHPMTLVRNAHGDVVGREAKNRTLWLLQRVEEALFLGDADKNPYAFDGVEKQIVAANDASITKDNVIDLRGAALDEDTLENAARISADKYGQITTLYAGNKVLTDLAKQILPNGRFQMPFGDRDGRLGYRVRYFDSQVGSFEMKPNVFLRPGGSPKVQADTNAPGTVPTIALAAAADATSLFNAGTYFYKVSAVNTNGETLPSAADSQVVAVGEKVNITINQVAGATSYNVYRGTAADNVKLMVSVKDSGAGTTVVADLNKDLPGTAKAYALMIDGEQGLAFKQLAPLMKMDLATIAASYRFMILLYGTCIIYAPLKMVVIKNIGAL